MFALYVRSVFLRPSDFDFIFLCDDVLGDFPDAVPEHLQALSGKPQVFAVYGAVA